jgi:hypothetical protein
MRNRFADVGLSAVSEFLEMGKLHGTTSEAIYWAITAALTGEAHTVEEALEQGASEWYK